MDTYIRRCTDIDIAQNGIPMNIAPKLRPGIFFDRDGTIIAEKNYLKDFEEIKILPGVIKALKMLKFANIPFYLVTNQAGVAHGFFDESRLNEVHHYLIKELNRLKISLRGIFYCPHHPLAEISEYRQDCHCRKPNPGLLYQAALIDRIDLQKSYLIGDKLIDIEAGKRASLKTILVLTGHGRKERAKLTLESTPDYIAFDLQQAAAWLLKDLSGKRRLVVEG